MLSIPVHCSSKVKKILCFIPFLSLLVIKINFFCSLLSSFLLFLLYRFSFLSSESKSQTLSSSIFTSNWHGGLRSGRHGGSDRLARFRGSDQHVGFVSGDGHRLWKWVLVVWVIRKKTDKRGDVL